MSEEKPPKIDAWIPFFIGDYLADTMHLSLEEHGAYLLLIFHYWRTGPVPDDPAAIARIMRISTFRSRNVMKTVRGFFEIREGYLFHKRIERDKAKWLAKYAKHQEKSRAGGRASAAARATTGSTTGSTNGASQVQPKPNPSSSSSSIGVPISKDPTLLRGVSVPPKSETKPRPDKSKLPKKEKTEVAPGIFMFPDELSAMREKFSTEAVDYYLPFWSDWQKNKPMKKDHAAFGRNWIRSDQQKREGFFRPSPNGNGNHAPRPTPQQFLSRAEKNEQLFKSLAGEKHEPRTDDSIIEVSGECLEPDRNGADDR
jgi:uncharacterized protein YdaU (DUF1376 family)